MATSDIVHSVAVCLTAVALPFMTSCGGKEEDSPAADAMETALCLNVEQISASRADVATLPDNEKMQSVRVVILRPDGTVEHNRHYSLTDAATNKLIILKVQSGESKTIYLFANEESVEAVEGTTGAAAASGGTLSLTSFFESYSTGMGGFATEVEKLWFRPDYVAADGSFKPIPMSSVYNIDVPAAQNFNGTFYVVRVATKFVVNFINWRGTETLVDYVGLESHALSNYLMAKVEDTERNTDLLADYNGSWIDWLKALSDASTENHADWLTDYTLPEGEASTTVYQSPAITVPNGSPGRAQYIFYLPESKHIKADATNGEQEYTMTFQITDFNAGIFECPLIKDNPPTNLGALFRNTEVIVNVQLLNHSIDVSIDVIPYSSVTLDPQFGLTPTTTTTTP